MPYEDVDLRFGLEYRARKSKKHGVRTDNGTHPEREPGFPYDLRQNAEFVDITEDTFSVVRP